MKHAVASIFFSGRPDAGEKEAINPHYIAFGYKRNQTEVMAAQLSAPVAVFSIISGAAHLRSDVAGFAVEARKEGGNFGNQQRDDKNGKHDA